MKPRCSGFTSSTSMRVPRTSASTTFPRRRRGHSGRGRPILRGGSPRVVDDHAMTMLEPELGRIEWPLILRIGRAHLYLVDDTDPTLTPLWEGDPTLGWEGDERLRVYVCPARAT